MESWIVNGLKLLIMPISSLLLLAFIGVFLLIGHNKYGLFIIIVALIILFILSVPLTAKYLARPKENFNALDLTVLNVQEYQAIVVLGGGVLISAPEYEGKDTVNFRTLERIRYAAKIARKINIPILVSGGRGFNARLTSEAELMAAVLQDEFGVKVKWLERHSRNTAENASYSYEILSKQNINRILLVTHALDMSRAVQQFRMVGFLVTPAPTIYLSKAKKERNIFSFMPSAWALKLSSLVLYEQLGSIWYSLRYRDGSSMHSNE